MTDRERRELERLARTSNSQIQVEAERRGHPNRTKGAAVGASVGAALGSFLGLPGAAAGGAIGGLLGAAVGNDQDRAARS